MADGTVRGTFELSARQPIEQLHGVRDAGREADSALKQLGTTMDTFGGTVSSQRIDSYNRKVRTVATTAESVAGRVDTSWGSMSRSIDRHATVIEGRIDRLALKLRDLGRINATPSVELNGFDRLNAQLTEIELRLDRLGSRTARPRVAMGGGFSNIAGGGGGGGAISSTTGGGAGPSSLFSALGGVPGIVAGGLALSPGIMGLLGGATSLVGSAGSAALGAGTVGLGGLGPLAVGGALSYATIRPAVQGLQAITKAQKEYTTAVQEFGRASTQAATAKRKLDVALLATPAAAGAARQLTAFQRDYQRAFAPAQAQFYRGVSGVLYAARGGLPSFGRSATTATGALSNAAINYTQFLTAPQQTATVSTLAQTFARELPIAERSLQNITRTLGNLTVAATPFFHEANLWVEHWTAGMATSSSDTIRVQQRMHGLVNDAKDWARLTGATYRLLRDIFTASAPTGSSMVVQLTGTLDRWDQWIRDNPQKVQAFFRQAETTTGNIARGIAGLVRDIAQLASLLTPIFNRAMQFISFVSGMGPGGMGILGALALGGYGGIRQSLGGRGPSAANLAGAFITGSAGPRFGGGNVATGVAAGAVGGLGASALRRASNLEVLQGRSASGAFLMGPATVGPAGTVARRAGFGAAETGFFGGLVASSPAAARGADFLGSARGVAGGALRGAARFALPILAITSALQAAQTPGNFGTKVAAGFSSAANLATLGLLPKSTSSSFGHGFVGALEGIPAAPFTGGLSIVGGALNAMTAPAGASFRSAPVVSGLQSLANAAGAVRTGPQLQQLQRNVTTSGALRFEMSPSDARKFQASLTQIMTVAAQNAGAGASNTWENAFMRGLDAKGPNKAVAQMLAGMETQIHELGPKGGRAFARDTAAWVGQMQQDNPKLQRPLQRLMDGIVRDLNQMNHTAGNTVKDLRDKIFYFNGQIYQGTDATWGAIRDSLVNKATVAQEKLAGIWQTIQREALDAMTQMGFSQSQARTIVTQTARGGPFAAAQNQIVNTKRTTGQTISQGGAFSPKARGGRLGGTGLLDSVPLPSGDMAAPGEAWIANRHTMQDLDRAAIAMYRKPAWEMIRDETRPHSAPARYTAGGRGHGALGMAFQNVATGLGQATARGHSGWVAAQHPELHAGIAQAVEDVLNRFPLTITSTTSGGHASGSYHYLGEAADIAGPSSTMYNAAQWIKASGLSSSLTEGIHNPNLSYKFGRPVPPGFWGATTWAQHANHIHMAVAGALGAVGAAAVGGGAMPQSIGNLRAPRSGLGGMPGALDDQISRIWARAMTQKVNSRIGPISGAGFHGGGSATANQQLGHRMMLAAGWPESQWPSLLALWNQESGWNANVVNASSGAYGIPQSLGHGHPYNLGDAPAQIAWGLNYIRSTYGSPAAAEGHERQYNWYQRGGQVNWAGWNAKGGDFITNGPTVFGAGERTREHVSITPVGQGRGGHHIVVRMEHVELSANADQIEHVAREVAGKILEALDEAASGTTDAALMGAGG